MQAVVAGAGDGGDPIDGALRDRDAGAVGVEPSRDALEQPRGIDVFEDEPGVDQVEPRVRERHVEEVPLDQPDLLAAALHPPPTRLLERLRVQIDADAEPRDLGIDEREIATGRAPEDENAPRPGFQAGAREDLAQRLRLSDPGHVRFVVPDRDPQPGIPGACHGRRSL